MHITKKLALSHSLLWILGSALLVNLSAYGVLRGVQFWKKKESKDLKAPIVAIIQTGPEKEALHTNYLAELLELSIDKPTRSVDFSLKWAQKRLLHSPLIKEAQVKLIGPGVIYVDYSIRYPIARLKDYGNIAMDHEGYIFPLTPFFTPKHLPEIYLGLEAFPNWNTPLGDEKVALAMEVLNTLSSPLFEHLVHVNCIDVSNAFAKSLGKQEIVVSVEDRFLKEKNGKSVLMIYPHILRLPPKKWAQVMSNYLQLHEQLITKEKGLDPKITDDQTQYVAGAKIIDLLIPQLAFIDDQSLNAPAPLF